ncbi:MULTISPECIES: Isoquinoline 1-oxidoreductase subunit [Bradyrhizobium]|uniref:Isoquinoline 1-oxidoreductase subunit n=1 Tax=Bradyrhizobium elkanii TaxID=29448 RepID=A0A4U6RRE6_BRAEL|nr:MULTISPECIES: Isoquinoline 1-oxidoreductase subunit [Bradyrhizobium]MTV13322.1 Isoquinoline 1-oxidoreductase subunit [Bradyrhizobium sp. BR2003]TKV77209.1 Isoquinoline 1-oxidoreductase subunit [Bradyrhizobium elkanii]
MPTEARFRIVAVLTALATSLCAGYAASESASQALASPESFAGIENVEQRSAAIFTELGKVLTHPRCTNCHPAGDSPRQGDISRMHQPPVTRGADGHGKDAMRCSICHQHANFDPGRVPGHPEWHLAPREMAWAGKTVGEICAQIRDPARNGGRKVEELIEHIGKDTLVGWAWHPGFGRAPAPGTQAQAGALVEAWVKTGAACPAP